MGDRADAVTNSPSDAHEERLAAALDDVASAGPIDWIAVGNRYPDLIDELRPLLAVGQVVDDLARRTLSHSGAKTVAPPTAPL
ncbi:MAG TPA: hypothetical protein VHR72_15640, partial [Gemmataceae bacterium]|nr:hypothetical protein [Gemmataceae bacterium]